MQAPEKLSFYWINNDEPGVHATPLPLSGWSVLDMAEYQDFWQRPIAEMGILAKPQNFNQAAIVSDTDRFVAKRDTSADSSLGDARSD
ncbi:MAG: hypothetical protein CM15mP103_11340 [Gammaproteobacteria bacterium]|nr:MAG: hypothetical protein CM15mP103_11340 [Gammaproteobacteria bacterium]